MIILDMPLKFTVFKPLTNPMPMVDPMLDCTLDVGMPSNEYTKSVVDSENTAIEASKGSIDVMFLPTE